MSSKCNCGKPSTSQWIIADESKRKKRRKAVRVVKFCDECKPKNSTIQMYQL